MLHSDWSISHHPLDPIPELNYSMLPAAALAEQGRWKKHNGYDKDLTEEQYIIFMSVRKLLNELTDDFTGNICKFFALVFRVGMYSY